MSKTLPKGWVEATLKDIVLHKKGKKPSKTVPENRNGYLPYILISEMEGKPVRAYTNDENIPVANENDVLIVWDGSIGKTATGIKGAIGSTIAALTPVIVETNLLNVFLQLSRPVIEQTSRGTGLQHINPITFWPLQFSFPPLNEQKRIAAKLDKIMPRIDALRERLDRIPQIIKRFRQAVLTSAVTGRLTEEWRGEHPDIESAKKLLERIKKEREKKYLKECEQAKKEGRKKPKKINLSSQVDTNSIDIELFPKWVLVNLNSICLEIVDCPHLTPKWAEEGKICLRTTNFKPNKLDWSELRYVSKKIYESRIARLKPLMADILYSREGGILGIACMLNKDVDICLGQRMMLLRPSKYIENIYITYLLNSPVILKHVHSLIGGSASPHVNVGAIKSYPIPLPPLEEQKEIVRQVNKLFAFADKLETRYKKAKEKIDKLPQSVLAKTFRGELVPQDPNDEPASELLKRIIAEKEKRQAEIKQTKKCKVKSKALKKRSYK